MMARGSSNSRHFFYDVNYDMAWCESIVGFLDVVYNACYMSARNRSKEKEKEATY